MVDCFVSKNGNYQNGFLIVFSNPDLTTVGSFFLANKKSEKTEYPKIGISFGGSMPEAQIK